MCLKGRYGRIMARLHGVECFMVAGFSFFFLLRQPEKFFFSSIDNDTLISTLLWA